MNEKVRNLIRRITSTLFPFPLLLRVIRAGTHREERIALYKDEIRFNTNKEERKRIFLDELELDNDKGERLRIYLAEAARLLEPEERFLLPNFEKGYGPETNRYSYQKEYVVFNIEPGEKVLDIGSGGDPFPLATHLADLFEDETTHRVDLLVKDGRPFEVCNVENLPYKEKEFDFVYCSHVLEHTTDPAKACEEIMRIGKRGYIETPTRISDIMFNFTKLHDHHRWHISILGDTLIFMEWTDGERRNTGCDYFFRSFHSQYRNPFQILVHDNKKLFVNMLLWKDKFFYFVFNKEGHLLTTNVA